MSSKKIFLDTNIFIDNLVNLDKLSDYGKIGRTAERIKASQITIEKYIEKGYTLVVSSLTLANAYYIFSERYNSKTKKSDFAKSISAFENSELFEVITDTYDLRAKAWQYAINNNVDYEDMLQYYSAKSSGCDFIITEDKEDKIKNKVGFPKLDLPLIDSYGNEFYTPNDTNTNKTPPKRNKQ